jgi:urea transport system ATP-binding protein
MLQVDHIDHYYGGSHILRGVTLDVAVGQCLGVLGRNGVGKTTLLKCMMGVEPIRDGKILFNGEDISRLAPYKRAQRGMAYVPQGREIFARLTVQENIQMGMATKPAHKARQIADYIYDLFPVLKSMLQRRGGDLSGGQQQQLAIARALVCEPKLIIFDEPTEGIQPSIIKDIGRVIQMLRDRGDMAIVLCEQYFDFAHELADRFVVMSRGEIVASGDQTQMGSPEVRQLLSV